MADIDVTEVLTDPDFADLVTVRRRQQVINGFGEATTVDTDTPNVIAYVMPLTGVTDRRDDGTLEPLKVTIVSTFQLRVATQDTKADAVWALGNWFTVTDVLPLSRFGAGFYESVATVMRPAYDPPTA